MRTVPLRFRHAARHFFGVLPHPFARDLRLERVDRVPDKGAVLVERLVGAEQTQSVLALKLDLGPTVFFGPLASEAVGGLDDNRNGSHRFRAPTRLDEARALKRVGLAGARALVDDGAQQRDTLALSPRSDDFAQQAERDRAAAPEADARMAQLIRTAVSEAVDARLGPASTGMGAPPPAQPVATSFGDQVKSVMGLFREVDNFRKQMGLGAQEQREPEVEEDKTVTEDPNAAAFGVRPIPFTNFGGKPIRWPKAERDEDGNEIEQSILEQVAKATFAILGEHPISLRLGRAHARNVLAKPGADMPGGEE